MPDTKQDQTATNDLTGRVEEMLSSLSLESIREIIAEIENELKSEE